MGYPSKPIENIWTADPAGCVLTFHLLYHLGPSIAVGVDNHLAEMEVDAKE
jgi:hypothetical protein